MRVKTPLISPFQTSGEVGEAGVNLVVGYMQGTAHHRQQAVWMFRFDLLCDQTIQPAGSDAVPLELISLQQLDEVLDRRSKFTTDRQFLQSNNQVSAQNRRKRNGRL